MQCKVLAPIEHLGFNCACVLARLLSSCIVLQVLLLYVKRALSGKFESPCTIVPFIAMLFVIGAEPLKKKKKVDPAVLRAREERKKKKIEKQIRRLEKNARQLKPIEECEVPLVLLDQKLERQREIHLSADVLEKRAILEKKWCQYKKMQHLADLQVLDRIQFAQQKALDELRKESEELYQAAIQFDFQMIPFKTVGPVETPPIENYDSPDGDYQDTSKKWN